MRSRLLTAAPWLYVGLLTAALAWSFLAASPLPQDDFGLYQSFIESLARGELDLSIPGFHGTDIFGVVVYLINRSPIAQIQGLIIASLLLPIAGFLAGRSLFRSAWHGMALATIVAMMPFISFVCLRGWTGPGYWLWMLLTLWMASRRSPLTGVFLAFAVLSKPFAVVLVPLIFVLFFDRSGFLETLRAWLQLRRRKNDVWTAMLIALLIVSAYLIAQFLQAGQIFVGAHRDLGVGGAIQGPMRIALNLAHTLQILFSVHNYYFLDPALTGPGNMMHTTPLLIFLGLFGLLSPGEYWKDLRLPRALLVGAILGILMNAFLDHMDHFYMEASILLLILTALPVLRKHPLWIPLVIATLHFQWFYFYLMTNEGFSLGWSFFAVPVVVDVCFLLWVALRHTKQYN